MLHLPMSGQPRRFLVAGRRPGPIAILLALLVGVGAAGCAAPGGGSAPASPAPLGDRIEALLATPPLDEVHWGVLAIDARTGRVLHERNAHLRFVPASNMKLPVTAAALDLLGPEYRWETAFYAHGLPVDGTVEGDLHLPGTGDPSLGEPFFDPPGAALRALADSLYQAGVREVTGALVLDASAWDSTTVPGAWMVGNLSSQAGATGGAFAVRSGELEVRIEGAGHEGEPARVEWEPYGALDFVEARVGIALSEELVPLRTAFLPESRRWIVEGAVRPGERVSLTLAARDPVRLGLGALAQALEERGITVRGGTRIIWERERSVTASCVSGGIAGCPDMLRLAGMASPPLDEVVPVILGRSQNWMTEQLVRTLGAEVGDEGSWSEGFRVITEHLEEELGVPPSEIHFRDGSGLSAYNLITPRAVIAILDHARDRPWGPGFREGLARPGDGDTTLGSRMEGLEGRLFAKTGTISHVNALSGYLYSDDGRDILFSIFTNTSNLPSTPVRDGIDALVRELASPSP